MRDQLPRARRRDGARADLYRDVTARIIAALEQGTVPWRQPWNLVVGRPASMSTRRSYRGINVLLLGLAAAERGYRSRWWGTYRQIAELGGQVRRGEKSVQVVFYKQLEIGGNTGAGTEDQVRRVPLLRAFWVFNAEQADRLPERFRAAETVTPELAGQPQDVLAGYLTSGGPQLAHAEGADPHYDPGRDQIVLPAPRQFRTREAYYATAFHEAAHSTGAPSRLGEIGGAMLCSATAVATDASLRDDSAAYIAGWLKALGDDRKLVVAAASQAERAADRVLEPERQAQPEPTAADSCDRPEPAATAGARLTAQWARTARAHLRAEPEAEAGS